MSTFDPEKITYFAKTDARGQEVSFGIKAKDRQRHMYVVGKTGMGKSTLLENMAAQDIQNGEGMAFIDPHGSAAETLLEYVPEHRVKDVVYFAPFDLNHPVSFNVMEDVGPDKRHLVVSGLMSTFKKIWVDAWSARMEYILTNALLALIEYPDTTLLSVNRLFIDKKYREKVVDYIKDPAVKQYWTEEFANYTERFTAEALPAIQNKIGQFTGNPLIRNIIGQPHSSFDIRQLMDDKKILIMNLSKGLIGETNANLLGSMLTTRIYLAAMSRADLPVAQMRQMPNFYFYVDEFQSFANSTFANILSEARKYHLNLIIAHQYIAQMEEEVRDAVFGNVGTTIAFRVGPFDGEVLETVFAPRFEATDLVNLGFAQIYLTLMIDGIGSQPFSAQTLPPVQLPPVSCKGMVVESSRKLYANKREEVEELVVKLHTPEKTEYQKKADARKQQGSSAGQKNGNGNNSGSGNSAQRQPQRNQNSTNNHAQDSDNDQKKPAHTHKSPDELRAILARMTGGDSTKKDNSVSVDTKDNKSDLSTKPDSQSKSQSSQSNQNGQSSNQKKSNHQPKKDQSSPSDLKSALADVLKKVDTAVAPEVAQQKESPKTDGETVKKNEGEQESKNSQPPREPRSEKSDDLKSTVSSVESTKKTNGVNDPFQPRRSVTVETKRAPQPQVVGNLIRTHQQNRQTTPSQPQRPQPSVVQSQVAPVDRSGHTEEKKSHHNPIDRKIIKKMLKHNDQERSPFV